MEKEALKEFLQKDAAQKVVQYKSVALPWATGVGKTFAALQAVEATHSKSVLVFVAERTHKTNWNDEITKFKDIYKGTLNDDVSFIFECYNSIHKYVGTECDMLIFDEAHHLHTQKRMECAKYITSEFTMYLSATIGYYTLKDFQDLYGKPIHTIPYSMNKSINANILPEPKIVAVPLDLQKANGTVIIEESWGRKESRVEIKCRFEQRFTFLRNKKLYKNVLLKMEATPYQAYNYYTSQAEVYKNLFMKERLPIFETKWKQYLLKRKKMLGSSKLQHAIEVINLLRLKQKKFICFCNNIEQAEVLGGPMAIHSKKSNNSEIIEKFNNDAIRELYAVDMLKEGQNLKGIEAGIIIQLDAEIRNFIQKLGRVMRSESPVFFVIFYKGTRDAELMSEAIADFDRKYITTLDKYKEENG